MKDQYAAGFTHTRNGNRFHLDDPSQNTVTLVDLVQSLVRLPRWTGNTVVPWSVGAHSLVCAMIASRQGWTPQTILYALLHDIEEAVMNDTPRPYKTAEHAEKGNRVRRAIYKHIVGLPYPPDGVVSKVREIDTMMLCTEAQCLMHPRARSHYGDADMEAADLVWEMLNEDEQTITRAFMNLYEALRKDPSIKSLEGRA